MVQKRRRTKFVLKRIVCIMISTFVVVVVALTVGFVLWIWISEYWLGPQWCRLQIGILFLNIILIIYCSSSLYNNRWTTWLLSTVVEPSTDTDNRLAATQLLPQTLNTRTSIRNRVGFQFRSDSHKNLYEVRDWKRLLPSQQYVPILLFLFYRRREVSPSKKMIW